MKNEQDRTQKYQILRQAGYTSKEANLLKDHSWAKVAKYVEVQQKYLAERNAMLTENSRTKEWK